MSSLLAERGPIHVHVGATILVEGEPPPFDELLAHVDRRLALVPRFRQKVTPTPLSLSNPEWTRDERFDLAWHVRRAALPRPGGMAELRELAGRIFSEPLDFTRPLWQLYLIEGLEGGRHAYVNKTHHALVDGVAAVDVAAVILDASPEAMEIEITDQPADAAAPAPEVRLVRAVSDRIRQPLKVARGAVRETIATPRSTATRVVKTAESFARLAASGPAAPRTFLNREIGRDRRVGLLSAELAQLKAMRGDSRATVNDVILSVSAGALRRCFERRGEPVPRHLVALVPMSLRRPEEEGELGNRIATLLVALPIGEPDPRRRLELIHEETTRLKASEQARAASLVIEATGWTPPTINRVLADVMARPLSWNLVVSNVPGPQLPLYLLGRRLEAIHPFVPLSPQNHALSIGVLSYDGRVCFGLAGDRDVMSDLEDLSADLEAAIAEQGAAAVAPR
jgi:WS/DGAT/MGAT family acyltransferase